MLVREALERPIAPEGLERYEGFNLIHGTFDALHYMNNVEPTSTPLEPGVHGLSNAFLNSAWPKVERARAQLDRLLAAADEDLLPGLFALLTDDAPAPEHRLPDTGLPPDMERAVSPIFIRTPGYGTRCSTVLLMDRHGGVRFVERTFPTDQVVEQRFALGTA